MGRPVSDSQPLRRSLQIALVVALVVLAAGMVFAFTQHGKYKAETSLIVLPANTLDTTTQANFLETLSRGQVTATMAEVAQSGRFETEAETAMGLSASEAAATTVTVTVVPSTSVLLITSEASTKQVAEGLADRTAALAATYLKSMIKPYTATQVRSAAGTAYPAGTSSTIILAGVVLAAIAVAVAAQQASYQVLQARRRTRRVVPTPGARRPATAYTGSAGAAPGAATRPGVAAVPTPTFGTPAPVAGTATATGSATATGTAPPSSSTATGTASPSTFTAKGTASPSTFTAIGTSPVTTRSTPNGSGEWSSPSGSNDWKTSVSVHTSSSGSADKPDDTATKPEDDSSSSAEESGVTNERVLFS
jgi:capsular polysaccharide biosynthesis protein